MEEVKNNMTPPEPPKDENGRPLPPPKGGRPPKGERPEPPKDENGRPLPPPKGGRPPKGERPEPPKDENGQPLAPPEAGAAPETTEQPAADAAAETTA